MGINHSHATRAPQWCRIQSPSSSVGKCIVGKRDRGSLQRRYISELDMPLSLSLGVVRAVSGDGESCPTERTVSATRTQLRISAPPHPTRCCLLRNKIAWQRGIYQASSQGTWCPLSLALGSYILWEKFCAPLSPRHGLFSCLPFVHREWISDLAVRHLQALG